ADSQKQRGKAWYRGGDIACWQLSARIPARSRRRDLEEGMSSLSGGPQERGRLIESHLPLVRSIARRYAGQGESLEDLVQVGSVALVRASDRFDPARGVAFATFAAPAVEGEIRRHLGERSGSVRIP